MKEQINKNYYTGIFFAFSYWIVMGIVVALYNLRMSAI